MYIRVCVYVCVHTYMCLYTRVRPYVHMCVHVCVRTWTVFDVPTGHRGSLLGVQGVSESLRPFGEKWCLRSKSPESLWDIYITM